MKTISPPRRVLPQDEHYSKLVEIRRAISKFQTWPNATMHPSMGLVHYVCSMMDETIGRENRNKFLSECFRREIKSSKDMTAGEQMGLLTWAGPSKDATNAGEPEKWHPSPQFITDLGYIQTYFGQVEIEIYRQDHMNCKKENQ